MSICDRCLFALAQVKLTKFDYALSIFNREYGPPDHLGSKDFFSSGSAGIFVVLVFFLRVCVYKLCRTFTHIVLFPFKSIFVSFNTNQLLPVGFVLFDR